ncbi:MAG: PTS cellobiose transporter subunit IIC [Cetobacterium sp.]
MNKMDKFQKIMDEYFLPLATKLSEQKHLQSIRDGLILSLPLVIVGSLFLVIGFLPIPGYNLFMANIFGDLWLTKLLYPVSVTFDLVSIIASIGIAFHLAKKLKIDSLSASVISLTSFFLVTPSKIILNGESVNAFSLSYLGGKGLFVAIICSLLSTEIYGWFIRKNYIIKMPDVCPPAVSKSFSALIPAFFILILFWLTKIGVESTSYGDIHKLIVQVISDPLTGFSSTILGGIVYVLINSIFWTFGIHGASISGIIFGAMFTVIRDANRVAFQNGEAIPHIISDQFFTVYVFLGGGGATIALVICYIIFSKAKQFKEIGKLSFGASIFNINEPVIFGSPVVLNPILMLPFILCPLVLTLISYVCISSGLVAPAVLPVPWTMPIILSGFISSGGHISSCLLQIFNLGVGILIYLPFVKILDKKSEPLETELEDAVTI